MLISLKMLLLQRAKIIGHGNLAENFDLKMLRALGIFSIGLMLLFILNVMYYHSQEQICYD
jgi:hypothetical protein